MSWLEFVNARKLSKLRTFFMIREHLRHLLRNHRPYCSYNFTANVTSVLMDFLDLPLWRLRLLNDPRLLKSLLLVIFLIRRPKAITKVKFYNFLPICRQTPFFVINIPHYDKWVIYEISVHSAIINKKN